MLKHVDCIGMRRLETLLGREVMCPLDCDARDLFVVF